MASTKSLEDMLSSDVDESAISALVGSLESQLASPTIHVTSQDISSASVTNNHINNSAVMDTFNRILHPTSSSSDGQKHGLLNSAQTSSNSAVISNSDSSKTLISSAPITPITSTTPVQANTFTVTLPGALPASGYLNQFQTVTVPAINSATTGVVQRTTTLPNGNVTSGSAIAAALSTSKTSMVGMGTTIADSKTVAVKPATAAANPVTGSNLNVNISGIGAMHNLASVAARQQPLVIPTSQQQTTTQGQATIQGHAGQTVIAVAKPAVSQATLAAAAGQGVSVATSGAPVNVVTQVVSNPQILQGMQIVNMNPVRTGVPSSGQKTLAPRVVIGGNPVRIATAGQQLIGARPGLQTAHGPIQNTITLPGMVRGALLVKTENGQYQLLNVGHALAPGTTTGTVPGTTTYRLQSLPPGSQTPMRGLGSQQMATVALPVSSNQHVRMQQTPQMVHAVLQAAHQPAVTMVSTASISNTTTQPTTMASPSIVQHMGVRGNSVVSVQPASQSQSGSLTVAPSHTTATVSSTTLAPSLVSTMASSTTSATAASGTDNIQSTTTPQMSPDTAKKKCKNFLSTLLRLANDQPEQVATNVKNLIQGLIDGAVPPEDFTNQLQKELNSSPQPCLIPFLKKSLPYLRHSLTTKELCIEGVRPPPAEVVALPLTPTVIPQIQLTATQAPRPTLTQPGQQMRLLAPIPANTMATHITHATLSDLAPATHVQRLAIPGQRLGAPIVTTGTQATSLLTPASNVRPVVTTSGNLTFAHPSTVVTGLHRAVAPSARMPTIVAGHKSAAAAATTLHSTQTVTSTVATVSSAHITASSAPGPASTASSKDKRNYSSSLKSAAEGYVVSRDDDDINDVATMGGVNLVEESARIMAQNAEFVGTQIRSCKDENFLFTGPLQRRIRSIAARHGLDDPPPEVAAMVSHATQERLKDIVGKLAVITEHRLDIVKNDPRHELCQDVKGQLKFLEELGRLEKKRHEEQEREVLLRAAKSRSKLEDPEQLKLKQKAKEMQRNELEEMRQREANMTALLAIGPRKKFKPDAQSGGSNGQQPSSSGSSLSGTSLLASSRSQLSIPRRRRGTLRDLVYLMEQERDTCRSVSMYKAFLK